jgi:hypothetical protein
MATGFIILILGTIFNRIVILKQNNGVTTVHNELIGFTSYLMFSMIIWLTIMFIYNFV